MRNTICLLIVTLFPVLASSAVAQDVFDSIVVTADDAAELLSDGNVVATVPRGSVLTIYDVGGSEYRVYWERNNGWISRNEVVPLDKAVEFFTESIRRNPTASDYNIRGMLWDELITLAYLSDDPDVADKVATYDDNAISDFTEAIRLDSGVASYYFNRGVKLAARDQQARAIDDYNEALRLDSEYTEAVYTYRGRAWSDLKQYEKAIADFTELVRLKPDDDTAFRDRGHAWYGAGDLDKSISDYNEAIRLNPEYAHNYVLRGYAFQARGELASAISDLSEAIRLAPEWGTHYDVRAGLWYRAGEYQKALDDYNEAIRLFPEFTSFHTGLAWFLATCPDEGFRNGEQAVELATKLCEETDWKMPYALNTYAAACAEAGDFEKAIEWQKKAVELCKDDVKEEYRSRLQLYEAGMPYREVIEECLCSRRVTYRTVCETLHPIVILGLWSGKPDRAPARI